MASIAIRNIEDTLKSRLRVQAAFHGRSMEDEARDILWSALSREPARLLSSLPLSAHASLGWAGWSCRLSRGADARAAVPRPVILLHTNVLSELIRPASDAAVEHWLTAQPDASMFISAIIEAELRYGAVLLPTPNLDDA